MSTRKTGTMLRQRTRDSPLNNSKRIYKLDVSSRWSNVTLKKTLTFTGLTKMNSRTSMPSGTRKSVNSHKRAKEWFGKCRPNITLTSKLPVQTWRNNCLSR
jgi:hypothetical protein